MKPYKILTIPNPILRKESKEITALDEKTLNLAERMLFTLTENKLGLALAAPQIGENVRMIVIGVNEQRDTEGKIIQKAIPLAAYINPVITKFSKEKEIDEEGCMSYIGYYGPVERSKKVKFKAMDINGKEVKKNASGLLARIIQHEVDHLDGILFVDRLTDKNKLRKVEIENKNPRFS